MQNTSINRLFRAGKLKRDVFGAEVFRPGKSLRFIRPLDSEILEGRFEGGGRSPGGGSSRALSLSKKLQGLTGSARAISRHGAVAKKEFAYDPRQRAVLKIHYFGHGGAGGSGLRAHARYVARDAASMTPAAVLGDPSIDEQGTEKTARAHSRYLRRGTGPTVFYDAASEGVDGEDRAARWSKQDRRHFRLILSAENGSRLGELKDYTRAVMRRAEMALGTKLEWVAVDHWDTDNPHTHIILRGVRQDGRDLLIPREFVQHGFRSAARDAATERLGNRTPDDERQAMQREVRAHRPTRLDRQIAAQIGPEGRVRVADLKALDGDPDVTDALKGRAHELRRLGLATEASRNVFWFAPNWQERLKAMELHLDIRKSLLQEKTRLVMPILGKSLDR